MEHKKEALKVLAHYGRNHQILKTVQELNELTVALTRWMEGRDGAFAEVVEELADVRFTTTQMTLEVGPSLVSDMEARKVARTLERMENEPLPEIPKWAEDFECEAGSLKNNVEFLQLLRVVGSK